MSNLNEIKLNSVVYEKARKSLTFLDSCIDPVTEKTPNYGANDGALFFKLTDDDYRVYTSQLNDLRAVLSNTSTREEESIHWYGIESYNVKKSHLNGIFSYKVGGYYIAQEDHTKTFLRCGSYKDRPTQSDNLHLDIWVGGVNYLFDTSSFKYNTDKQLINYFNGTGGHNTVSVSENDQMLKGGRFIWYYWIKNADGNIFQTEKDIIFEGKIIGYRHLCPSGLTHYRKVVKKKGLLQWIVYDEIQHDNQEELIQYWHIHRTNKERIIIKAYEDDNSEILPFIEEKWYSEYYGIKENCIRLSFKTKKNAIKTEILIH